MGDLLYVDFRGGRGAKAELACLAAHFMQWITPTLEAAHIEPRRHSTDDASTNSELESETGTARSYTSRDLTYLRENIRDVMTELYLQHHGVAPPSLRRALLAALGVSA